MYKVLSLNCPSPNIADSQQKKSNGTSCDHESTRPYFHVVIELCLLWSNNFTFLVVEDINSIKNYYGLNFGMLHCLYIIVSTIQVKSFCENKNIVKIVSIKNNHFGLTMLTEKCIWSSLLLCQMTDVGHMDDKSTDQTSNQLPNSWILLLFRHTMYTFNLLTSGDHTHTIR